MKIAGVLTLILIIAILAPGPTAAKDVLNVPAENINNEIDKQETEEEVPTPHEPTAVTWRDNPEGCNMATQYIRKDNFQCLEKQKLSAQPDKKVEKTAKQAAKKVEKKTITSVSGDKTKWMRLAGIPQNEWAAVDYIITHESTWRTGITNSIGCIGLYQACPAGDKARLLAMCPNWETDIVCTLRAASQYSSRYGGWNQAKQAWIAQGWW